MARPLRIEYPYAVYHITSRGNRHEPIYADDRDRSSFLDLLGESCTRFEWNCYAYCLMSNHYHLVMETVRANLSRGMRHLNGVYAQRSNRRHHRVGHVFQGRYHAVLVDRDAYLLEACRYVVLNPVRAGMVEHVVHWPWSSYRAMLEPALGPDWLARDALLQYFSPQSASAAKAYRWFIARGEAQPRLWDALRHQIFLGDARFVAQTAANRDAVEPESEVPKSQRQAVVKSLSQLDDEQNNRSDAMRAAYATGQYTMKEIADYFRVHYSTVSRAVNVKS